MAGTSGTTASDSSYTQRLVEYAASFRLEDLPPEAIPEMKTMVMDILGAMLAASHPMYSSTRLVCDYVRGIGGREECTVVGRGFKVPVDAAALANGTMGYAADIEGGQVSHLHVGAVIVPAALAMAERQKAGGRALMAAIALGFELCCRVAQACRTPHSYPHSFHPSAVFGHIGAAAAAGHLLGLKGAPLTNAFGLATINASGLVTWVDDPTEDSRPLVIGMAARGGIIAALLAGMGFGGPLDALDSGKFNIYDAFSGEMHLDRLVKGLGEEYWILKAEGYKRHPCCGGIHSGLDGLLSILAQHDLAPQEIAAITHRVRATRASVIDNNPLRSHCAQYIMAVAALDRRLELTTILQDRSTEPAIRALMDRVKLVADPALDELEAKSPAVVEVVTTDGRRFVERVDYPRGATMNPMSRSELEEKFFWLATTVVDRVQAEEILEMVRSLERLSDVGDLMAALRVRG